MNKESASDLRDTGLTIGGESVPGDRRAGPDGPSITPEGRAAESTRDTRAADPSRLCDEMTNVVEIVGTVMQQRRTDRGSIARTLISPTRAVTAQIALQVHEEDGEAYGLQLVFPPRAAIEPGLLAALVEGERLEVRGRLSWRDTYDLRYASAEHPLGRSARELVVTVLEFARAEDAAIDGSWVRVQGSVLVPPQLRPHETLPGLRVARTSVQVTTCIPSTRPGSRAEFIETANIPIDIPLDLPTAGAGLRMGNLVTLEGRLERYRQRIHPERSEPIRAAITMWRTRHERELEDLAGEGRDAAQRRAAREVRSLLYEDRLRLRAGYIEMITGMMLDDLDEVVRNRQVWTSAAQARRTRYQPRQERTEQDVAPKRAVDGDSCKPHACTAIRRAGW